MYPYTVGPTEFVIAFFKEVVFKRIYKNSVSAETDVRTHINLRTEEDNDDELALLQSNLTLQRPYAKCQKCEINSKYQHIV
jgi:hypothetical protein